MTTTLDRVNPPPTPARGVATDRPPDKLGPPPRFHPEHCAVCSPDTAAGAESYVDRVGSDAPTGAVPVLYGPQLTPGQRRVFSAEIDRLIRLLQLHRVEDDGTVTRYGVRAVLVLLEDMAGQAPAVDAVIAAESARRREAAAARPTIRLSLEENRR